MPETLTLTRPDDWHLHLRDGAALAAVLPHTARQFGRAIVMPNLRPPVTTTALALAYRERILAALPPGADFEPLMTLYLTDNTPPEEIRRAQGGRRGGGQALPGRRHHQQRRRRHRPAPLPRHAGSDAARGPAAAGARRGHRPRGRHLRPRGGLHRARDAAAAARLPGAEGRVRAHHDAGRGRLRGRQRRTAPPPRSPRTTCSTTATRCSPAACARTTTACRC